MRKCSTVNPVKVFLILAPVRLTLFNDLSLVLKFRYVFYWEVFFCKSTRSCFSNVSFWAFIILLIASFVENIRPCFLLRLLAISYNFELSNKLFLPNFPKCLMGFPFLKSVSWLNTAVLLAANKPPSIHCVIFCSSFFTR